MAEWDVIAETRATIDIGGLWDSVQFRHIKGHADKKAPYHQLTLMQQLNIDADKLADDYIQQNQSCEYSRVSLLPTSGVQVNMQGGTVMYCLKQTVTQARSQREHQQYLCRKNN
jgi:hypothetical protein